MAHRHIAFCNGQQAGHMRFRSQQIVKRCVEFLFGDLKPDVK